MEAPVAATQLPSTSETVPGRSRHRGPRRGRGQGRGGASLSFRPSSIAPASEQGPASLQSGDGPTAGPQQTSRNRRGRAGRAQQSRTVAGRQFGGQLTHDDQDSQALSSASAQLQADAAVFVPGRPHVPSTTTAPSKPKQKQTLRQPKPAQRRLSKSQAPDIATRTHEDIDHGHYECPICTNEVQRSSKVWACHTCWTVFHLSCIKKWSTNEGSAAARQQEQSDMPPPRQWRCPGCNLPKDEMPNAYTCWCEKELEPRAPPGVPPHSCGSSCGRERAKKCPHPCALTCHAGPCPPCTHMGPTLPCFCGKHDVTKRCSETDYDNGWSCGEICGELLPCGEHTCSRPCHEGLCGACEERVPARCYCGQVEKDVLCDDRQEEIESFLAHSIEGGEPVTESWVGSFLCGNIVNRPFDCGIHKDESFCHVQQAAAEHCPRSPDVVSHCPCGKTPLKELTNPPRQSCEDPIPSCQQPCGKTLACGHLDPTVCHTGDCPSCTEVVEIKCRCGRTSSRSLCHQGKEEPPQCMRVCRTTMNCGRHAHDERCCPGEKKAAERNSSKRKQRPFASAPRSADDGLFESEHICTLPCGRLLKCGIHVDDSLCHKGPCGTCREAIFEEVSCHCGRTVLQPPLPCGTKPPPCRYPCSRPKGCGHPQVPHNCHQDDESCPKCPFLVEKRCMCGKKTLKNQPCWLPDVRCGEVCGAKLRCGSHQCRRPCHRPGECEDAHGERCTQPCGKAKKICGHPHLEDTCHAPFPCKEDQPCQSKILIMCACQAQKQEMKCGASTSTEGNGAKTLLCNEECARLERNRRLAVALNIDQTTHVEGGDHIPYSTETLNYFSQHVKWAQTQEREFRVFATSDDEKRLRFKPMKAQERAFVHGLADDFGFDSESMDPEPHRHVMIWKTPRFVSAPNKTLADALRIRTADRSATASANVSDNEGMAKRAKHVDQPFNSFVISKPRFGLTLDELRTELTGVLDPALALSFDIEFLPSDEVVLKALSRTLLPDDLQQTLLTVKPPLNTALTTKGYGSAELCHTDSSLNITRRESDSSGGDGWSRVAAKKAAPRFATQATGVAGNNSFAALTGGGKVTFAKKPPQKVKPKKEVIVDDWEAAEQAEEERERVTSDEEGGARTVSPVALTIADPDSTAVGGVNGGHAAGDGLVDEQEIPEAREELGHAEPASTDAQDWASQVEAASH